MPVLDGLQSLMGTIARASYSPEDYRTGDPNNPYRKPSAYQRMFNPEAMQLMQYNEQAHNLPMQAAQKEEIFRRLLTDRLSKMRSTNPNERTVGATMFGGGERSLEVGADPIAAQRTADVYEQGLGNTLAEGDIAKAIADTSNARVGRDVAVTTEPLRKQTGIRDIGTASNISLDNAYRSTLPLSAESKDLAARNYNTAQRAALAQGNRAVLDSSRIFSPDSVVGMLMNPMTGNADYAENQTVSPALRMQFNAMGGKVPTGSQPVVDRKTGKVVGYTPHTFNPRGSDEPNLGVKVQPAASEQPVTPTARPSMAAAKSTAGIIPTAREGASALRTVIPDALESVGRKASDVGANIRTSIMGGKYQDTKSEAEFATTPLDVLAAKTKHNLKITKKDVQAAYDYAKEHYTDEEIANSNLATYLPYLNQ